MYACLHSLLGTRVYKYVFMRGLMILSRGFVFSSGDMTGADM